MCFKNLPIEFDQQGNATLLKDVPNPYDYNTTTLDGEQDKLKELLARNGFIKNVDFDPVTRVAGALAFHSVVDLKNREVLSTNSMATLFRGYEIILKGRDPRDASYISSRACGVCGGVHATVSALAMEMALGITPPPLGVVVRNLLLSLEYLYDHPLHLFLLAGPDYSEQMVTLTNPSLFQKAQKTPAKFEEMHGYSTIGEIMHDLNPLTGKLYVEALHMTRVAREAYVLIGGKYPHPQTVVPGGVAVTIDISVMNEMYERIQQFFDYSKKVVGIWDDVFDFFLESNPEYEKCGYRPATMMDSGVWDRPGVYDASYKNMTEWGKARWATPGVLVDGKLVTTDLQRINAGYEEFVEHSFYEKWDGQRFPRIQQVSLWGLIIPGTKKLYQSLGNKAGVIAIPGMLAVRGIVCLWKLALMQDSISPLWLRSFLKVNSSDPRVIVCKLIFPKAHCLGERLNGKYLKCGTPLKEIVPVLMPFHTQQWCVWKIGCWPWNC